MSSTYRSRATARDQQVADEYLGEFMPCRYCGRSTERATLTEYGARCGDCYTAYVTGGRPLPTMPTREERAEIVRRVKAAVAQMGRPGRQWAEKLRQREQAGEQLSMAQREAWRAAIGANELLDSARDGQEVSREAIDEALTVTGDLPSMDVDESLWASRFRDAERDRFAADPRFAAWAART